MPLAVADVIRYLVFPVAVLLVGALVTGVLIPELARRRDAHRQALTVKTELVGEMSETVMEFVMAIQSTVLPGATLTQEQYNDAYKRWETRAAVLGTKIRAYFPQTAIAGDWSAFVDQVTRFYALSGVHEPDERQRRTADLLDEFALGPVSGPEAEVSGGWIGDWGRLKDAILEEKSRLIQRVLRARAEPLEGPALRVHIR